MIQKFEIKDKNKLPLIREFKLNKNIILVTKRSSISTIRKMVIGDKLSSLFDSYYDILWL